MENCLECGAEYRPVRKDQRYCSKKCRTVVTIRKAKIKRLNGFDEEKVKWLVSQVNSFYEDGGFIIDQSNIHGFSPGLKQAVKERDNFECQVCTKVTDLEVHHIIPKAKGGKHSLRNLITLCHSCHRHIEAGDEVKAVNKCFKNYKKHYIAKGDTI